MSLNSVQNIVTDALKTFRSKLITSSPAYNDETHALSAAKGYELNQTVSNVIGNIGDVITGNVAQRDYVAGEYVVYNNLLYRIDENVASGSTFTIGTNGNLTQTNAANEITTINKIKNGNDYTDITDDFDSGLFSAHLKQYHPGNYIKKTYSGTTYVAVLADYNTFYGTQNNNAVLNTPHWTAIVFGFTAGQMNTSNTTANGFTGSAMNTWLKGACTTAVQGAFGTSHLKAHQCLLSTGTYSSSSATHGFSWAWESGHYTMLMSEAQLGYRGWSDLGWSTGEAYKPLQIFLNESFMSVLGRDYGQSNNVFNTSHAWLRDISAVSPGAGFCGATDDGVAGYGSASDSFGRFPLIILV